MSHHALNGAHFVGRQRQRLYIARALAVHTKISLLDEPTASLDPVCIQRIEELMIEPRNRVTMMIGAHNMQHVARVFEEWALWLMDRDRAVEFVEFGITTKMLPEPSDARILDDIQGRFD